MIETMVAVAGGVILGGLVLKYPRTFAKWGMWGFWLCAYVAFGFLAHSSDGWLGVAAYVVTLIAWGIYLSIIDALPVMPTTWSGAKRTVVGYVISIVAHAVYFAAGFAALALHDFGILRLLPLVFAFGALHLIVGRLKAVVAKREEAWKQWRDTHPCPIHDQYCEDPCAYYSANVAAFQGTLFGSRFRGASPGRATDALTPAERAYADALLQARLGDSTALASAIEAIKAQNGSENLTPAQVQRIGSVLGR